MKVLEGGRFLSVKEAAQQLGVSPGRVRQLICWGELPAQKIGPIRLIRYDDLRKIMQKERKPRRPKSSN